jgi:hypothetical protein
LLFPWLSVLLERRNARNAAPASLTLGTPKLCSPILPASHGMPAAPRSGSRSAEMRVGGTGYSTYHRPPVWVALEAMVQQGGTGAQSATLRCARHRDGQGHLPNSTGSGAQDRRLALGGSRALRSSDF